MTASKTERLAATVLFAIVFVTALAGSPARNAGAVTRTLQSEVCVDTTNVPTHYSFTKTTIPYWTVVGVAPQTTDDKDIYLYSGPNATGTVLAYSTAVDGLDFVVGDFNHTPWGTYYPTATYGSTTASYKVEWHRGGHFYPVNEELKVELAVGGAACNMFEVMDVKLEAGATYRLLITSASEPVRLALFRNPGTGAYWAGRYGAVAEVAGTSADADYVAPVTDWYGLVLCPAQRPSTEILVTVEVRKLGICRPLAEGVCESPVAYTVDAGPDDSFYFQQTTNFWSAFAVSPSPARSVESYLRYECDYSAADYAPVTADAWYDETSIVLGDFNHAAALPSTAYVTFDCSDPGAPVTIEWENGYDHFPVNSTVSGSVGGTSGACNLVEIWDIFLESGLNYTASFSRQGTADVQWGLYENPGHSQYYTFKDNWIWHTSGTGSITASVPITDYHGLLVFANKRGESGSYTLTFERAGDCDDVATGTCVSSQGNAKDFHIGAVTNDYWVAVGVLPWDGDDKDISVFQYCDGQGGLLAFSNGTQGMDFVVVDCNHPPLAASSGGTESPEEPLANDWYPRVTYGSSILTYTVSSDLGNSISEDLFPHDVAVPGVVGGTSGECGMLKIWDVYLQAGVTYTFGFTRGGTADVRAALFRNTTNNRVYLGRSGRVWELAESQNYDFTAPATDYYGLVVFANKRGKTGSYTLRVSRASGVTGIDPEPFVPNAYALYQNAPNPFNPTTEIRYDVPSSGGRVQLRVYDVHGRLVRTLVDASETGGAKSAIWDARDNEGSFVATGVYFYRLDAPGFSETRKMVVMK